MWLGVAAALCAWPIVMDYSPLAATLGSANAREVAYDLAFGLVLVGALYSSHCLASKAWLFNRGSSAGNAVLHLAWVGVGGVVPALLSLLPLIALQGAQAVPGTLMMGLIALHAAAILLLLGEAKFSTAERSLALLFLAVALPALVPLDSGALSLLARTLDPASGARPGVSNSLLISHQLGSIVLLTLAAHALRLAPLRRKVER